MSSTQSEGAESGPAVSEDALFENTTTTRGATGEADSGYGSESDNESDWSDQTENGGEPFDTFKDRVLELALFTLWPDAVADQITIERLPGGWSTRIIGISYKGEAAIPGASTSRGLNAICSLLSKYIKNLAGVQPKQTTVTTDYILRIDRGFDRGFRMHDSVAQLQFASCYTSIPVPEVVSFDSTNDNPLGSQYAIYKRVPGVTAFDAFPTLTHESRCKLARQMGNIYRQMLEVRSSTGGKPMFPPGQTSLDSPIQVGPFDFRWWHQDPADREDWTYIWPDPAQITPYSHQSPSQSVYVWMQSLLRARASHDFWFHPWDVIGWISVREMIDQINERGYLNDLTFSLSHSQLTDPRHIWISTASGDPSAPIIASVLDWNYAMLAPSFNACDPPMWLWSWQDDLDELQETQANDVPETPENREIKAIFEEAAGPEYVKFAYSRVYRMLRDAILLISSGQASSTRVEELTDTLQEWKEFLEAEKNT